MTALKIKFLSLNRWKQTRAGVHALFMIVNMMQNGFKIPPTRGGRITNSCFDYCRRKTSHTGLLLQLYRQLFVPHVVFPYYTGLMGLRIRIHTCPTHFTYNVVNKCTHKVQFFTEALIRNTLNEVGYHLCNIYSYAV